MDNLEEKPMNFALPSVGTVKPFCNKRITLTHTANNLIQAKQMKTKHSGLSTVGVSRGYTDHYQGRGHSIRPTATVINIHEHLI